MGKTSRRKGAAYENTIAKLFREAGWTDAKRHLEFQFAEALASRDLDGTQPFSIQVKCWKKTPSITAIEEITPNEEYPIRMAVLKRTRVVGKPSLEVAVVDLNTMMKVLGILMEYELLGLLKDELFGKTTDDEISKR